MSYRLLAQQIDQHALVLGAGMPGLLVARVLAEHFTRVTVIAEQPLPDSATYPQNIWQAVPSHLLSIQGQRNLERLFPGLQTELLAAGAPTVDWTADAPLRLPGGWGPRFHADLVTRSASPNLLAQIIRERVLEYGRECVSFRAGQAINQVTSDGVRLGDTWMEADLIVDTLGRESRLMQWLADMGHDMPQQTDIAASVSVAVRLYRPTRQFDPGWKAMLVLPHQSAHGGILVPVEEGGWLVMLLGAQGLDPPEDDAGFVDFAPPPLRDALRQAEALTPIYRSHDTANRWWHIERLSQWPHHILTTSAVVYNPAFGLDLTMATLAALTLRDALNEQRKNTPAGGLHGLGGRFQHRLARANDIPWRMVTAIDGSWASTPHDHLSRFARWFGGHLLAAARLDSAIYQTLIETAGLITAPYTLLNPAFAHQVMRHSTQPSAPSDSATPPALHATNLSEISAHELTSTQIE